MLIGTRIGQYKLGMHNLIQYTIVLGVFLRPVATTLEGSRTVFNVVFTMYQDSLLPTYCTKCELAKVSAEVSFLDFLRFDHNTSRVETVTL